MAFDHRQHRLAGTRHIAAEQQPDTVELEQAFRQRTKLLGVGRRIVDHRLDHPIEHAAAGIDLLNGEKGRIELRLFDRGCHSRLGEQDPYAPGAAFIFAETHDSDLDALLGSSDLMSDFGKPGCVILRSATRPW